MILTFQITEYVYDYIFHIVIFSSSLIFCLLLPRLVMFESQGTERPGYNFHLTVQSEETAETVVVKIRDSDSTYVTDKWLPT